jgi:MinD-like ATPase involved in chromosome partitioning or flagellar assembly
MYVVTFYSFKGGVGRTMALVNTAVKLAEAGRTVLTVDFDLEAPGIATYPAMAAQHEGSGLVDYVTSYLESGEVADVKQFLYQAQKFESGGSIWVMPVGRNDADYSRKLNSIDWGFLYGERQGFLFFEDLRRQWDQVVAPDYVLIDSRTGHSDVEGICTRQLPNAVCLFFFPNEQNVLGLRRIVSTIRASGSQSQIRKPVLHFVASNVPDLDDEDQILSSALKHAREELRYQELAARIHHYNSLSLLNQEIFTLSRPNSRLAKEYARLTKAITSKNLGDRTAVLERLKASSRSHEDTRATAIVRELLAEVDLIRKNFSGDGEVQFWSAKLYEKSGNAVEALAILKSELVEKSFPTAGLFATRARLSVLVGERDAAARDLERALEAPGGDLDSFLYAASDMEQVAPYLYSALPSSPAFNRLSATDQAFVALQLDDSERQLEAQAQILDRLLSEPEKELAISRSTITRQLSLALIRIGLGHRAATLLEPLLDQKPTEIANLFNYAMARWAADQIPSQPLFRRVANEDESSNRYTGLGPNYAFCLAIVNSVLGKYGRAANFIDEARRGISELKIVREFSPWTYTKVDARTFLGHLTELEDAVKETRINPPCVRASQQGKVVTTSPNYPSSPPLY